jgi:hypothetical protein
MMPGLTFDQILTNLTEMGCDPRKVGGSYSIRCPHPEHDDSNPSATLKLGDDGRVLLSCFSRCDTGDRGRWFTQCMDAIRDRTLKRTPTRRQRSMGGGGGGTSGSPVAEYIYRDETGEPVAKKVRYVNESGRKSFAWKRPYGDGWADSLGSHGGITVPLYNLDRLHQDRTSVVYLVEGEKDADSIAGRGYLATTTPHGAGGSLPDLGCLAGRFVVVIADRDRPGTDHARTVAAELRDLNPPAVVELRLPIPEHKGADVTDHLAEGHNMEDLGPWPDQPQPAADSTNTPNLDVVLAEALGFVQRFVSFPNSHAAVATALWAAHTHLLDHFDSTPRLSFLSPEPGSGKTRALEVLGSLVPNPMHAVNATPAALFRSVSDLEQQPTILYDEIDTVFGPKTKENNEEVRAFLNAGHRRSGEAFRCVGMGTNQTVKKFPTFAAVALAGLNDLPDTIGTRSVIIRMRRRKRSEKVESWRARHNEVEGHQIRDRLAAAMTAAELPDEPPMPEGVEDRPADVWEPLLAVAHAAGGEWPELAEAACRTFVLTAPDTTHTTSLQLLEDLRTVFGEQTSMSTADIIKELCNLEESPWKSLGVAGIDAVRLSKELKKYGVKPLQIRGERNLRGYYRNHLADPWERYLPKQQDTPGTQTVPAAAQPNPLPAAQPATSAALPVEVSRKPATPATPATARSQDALELRKHTSGSAAGSAAGSRPEPAGQPHPDTCSGCSGCSGSPAEGRVRDLCWKCDHRHYLEEGCPETADEG